MQVDIGLQGRGTQVCEPLDASPNPVKSRILDHLDGLREGLSAIRKSGVNADTVQEIGRWDGSLQGRLAPANQQDDIVKDLFIEVLGAQKNQLAE
jgi:hypothetical protein